MNYKDCKPGDMIPVTIEGKVYETFIDEHDVQRFPTNSVFNYMFYHDKNGRALNMHDGRDIHNGMLGLTALCIAFQRGELDKREYMEVVMSGYSVSGFCDLHEFSDWTISNPIWNDGAPSRIGGEEEDENEDADA